MLFFVNNKLQMIKNLSKEHRQSKIQLVFARKNSSFCPNSPDMWTTGGRGLQLPSPRSCLVHLCERLIYEVDGEEKEIKIQEEIERKENQNKWLLILL